MSRPRIPPGGRAEIGVVNSAIARALGKAGGTGGPPNVFTTLGRHRRLFRRWLWFAGGLMPGGVLPRRDTELVILRVAHNCDSGYEWHQHERIARRVGLSGADIEHVRSGPERLPLRSRLLVAAADELHADRMISDGLWGKLVEEFSEVELIELCLLVGHYEMLAMALNSLRVQPE